MIPLSDNNPTRRKPLVVWALVALNIAAFSYELSLSPERLELLVHHYGMIPRNLWRIPTGLEQGMVQWLPVLTSMFLHGGWLHLIGNIWILWLFGDNIEDRLGHGLFLLFYVGCGGVAALLHSVLHASSTVPTIGASGAIAGVMGAYFLLFPFKWITVLVPLGFIPLFLRVPAFVYLFIWIAAQLIGGYATVGREAAGVAFWAHVGGFFAGMYWIRKAPGARHRR